MGGRVVKVFTVFRVLLLLYSVGIYVVMYLDYCWGFGKKHIGYCPLLLLSIEVSVT